MLARRLPLLLLLAACSSPPPPAPEDETSLPPELVDLLLAERRDAIVRLKLTPEQIEDAHPIIRRSMRQRWDVALRYKEAPRNLITLSKVKRELSAINKAAEVALEEVFTPEQMEEYRKILKELRDKAIAEYKRRAAEE